MKRLIIVLALLLMVSVVAMAQEEKVQVFGGWQFVNADNAMVMSNGRPNLPKGWDADFAVKATKHVAVVGDFSGSYKYGNKYHTFMFGPRVMATSGKVTPFGEVLFGGLTANYGWGTHFSMAMGGGLDVSVNKRVSIRLAKFDYNLVRAYGVSMHNLRLATGIVFKF